MCVENTFETGAVGALHSHPHTQITYVAVSYTHLKDFFTGEMPFMTKQYTVAGDLVGISPVKKSLR